jgi:hypothetical protein
MPIRMPIQLRVAVFRRAVDQIGHLDVIGLRLTTDIGDLLN